MATYFGREVLLHQLIEQKKLHRAMFSKIKDRKAKIRKFMIFVNNVLNETEAEMQQLWDSCCILEKLVFGCGDAVVPSEVSLSQFKELARHIADQSISEKKLTVSGKLVSPEAKSEDNESSLISHTVTDSSPLEQTQDLIKYQLQDRRAASSQLSIDETVGYDCDSVDQQEQTSQRSDGTVREGDHLPLSNKNEDEKSPPPSPVSTLLNEVFVSINGDGQSSSEEGKNLLHNIQEKQPAMDFSRASGGIAERKPQPKSNRPVSPLSVSDAEEGEAAAGDNSSDSLIFCEPPVPRDIIVTKVKQKVKWPISYPKPAARGELVVEPATPASRKNRRVRQTRLDGFLSRSSNEPSSSGQLSVITIGDSRRTKRKPSPMPTKEARSGVTEVANVSNRSTRPDDTEVSDDDAVSMDVGILQPGSSFDPSVVPTSTQASTQSLSKHHLHSDLSSQTQQQTQGLLPIKRKKFEPDGVVRGKARMKLPGYRCKQCYEYYKSLDLTEEQITQRLNEVCRHRALKPPMDTPPNFWNMSIVSNLESSQ